MGFLFNNSTENLSSRIDMVPAKLKRSLLQGELADLALYQALRKRASGPLAKTLDHFIVTETQHVSFWRTQYHLSDVKIGWDGFMRNLLLRGIVGMLGPRIAFLVLEAVETHGIQNYLTLWEKVEDPTIREGLRVILTEELLHEDEAATQGERTIRPDIIRNAFLGFNDGSVEILGAVNGLYAALGSPSLVAISAFTVSFAGAISMAAGAFLATHSETELQRKEVAKQRFLGNKFEEGKIVSPWSAARLVGIAYLIGASVPVLPFLLGATHPWWSILCSGALILLVSAMLAFLSGMTLMHRILLNMGVIICSVAVSGLIGKLVEIWFGIASSA